MVRSLAFRSAPVARSVLVGPRSPDAVAASACGPIKAQGEHRAITGITSTTRRPLSTVRIRLAQGCPPQASVRACGLARAVHTAEAEAGGEGQRQPTVERFR